jgi:Holliday junction resolvase RusA-like endonuclease
MTTALFELPPPRDQVPAQDLPTWIETATEEPAPIRFFATGFPKGQPRPRAFSRGGHARVYDPGTAEGWKGCVAQAVKPLIRPIPIEVPVVMRVTFHMPRPQRLMGKKHPAGVMLYEGKPDVDNLAKAVMDCLTTVGLWRDDAQVVRQVITKLYAPKGGRSGALVEVWTLPATLG